MSKITETIYTTYQQTKSNLATQNFVNWRQLTDESWYVTLCSQFGPKLAADQDNVHSLLFILV